MKIRVVLLVVVLSTIFCNMVVASALDLQPRNDSKQLSGGLTLVSETYAFENGVFAFQSNTTDSRLRVWPAVTWDEVDKAFTELIRTTIATSYTREDVVKGVIDLGKLASLFTEAGHVQVTIPDKHLYSLTGDPEEWVRFANKTTCTVSIEGFNKTSYAAGIRARVREKLISVLSRPSLAINYYKIDLKEATWVPNLVKGGDAKSRLESLSKFPSLTFDYFIHPLMRESDNGRGTAVTARLLNENSSALPIEIVNGTQLKISQAYLDALALEDSGLEYALDKPPASAKSGITDKGYAGENYTPKHLISTRARLGIIGYLKLRPDLRAQVMETEGRVRIADENVLYNAREALDDTKKAASIAANSTGDSNVVADREYFTYFLSNLDGTAWANSKTSTYVDYIRTEVFIGAEGKTAESGKEKGSYKNFGLADSMLMLVPHYPPNGGEMELVVVVMEFEEVIDVETTKEDAENIGFAQDSFIYEKSETETTDTGEEEIVVTYRLPTGRRIQFGANSQQNGFVFENIQPFVAHPLFRYQGSNPTSTRAYFYAKADEDGNSTVVPPSKLSNRGQIVVYQNAVEKNKDYPSEREAIRGLTKFFSLRGMFTTSTAIAQEVARTKIHKINKMSSEQIDFEVGLDNNLLTQGGTGADAQNRIGIYYVLNARYSEDTKVNTWLDTDSATERVELRGLNTGLLKQMISLATSRLNRVTTEVHEKIIELRETLKARQYAKWVSGLFIVSAVFGIALMLYAVAVVFAFYFDIVAGFAPDIALLSMISGLTAVSSQAELVDIKQQSGGGRSSRKYVSHREIWITFALIGVAGVFFFNVSKIIDIFLWFYSFISGILG